jgi:23S rRNA maturation-related 3'-5' exoribonuclease YhaM
MLIEVSKRFMVMELEMTKYKDNTEERMERRSSAGERMKEGIGGKLRKV